jgi:ADP-heptose:LPS heptosyltransferase
VEFNYLIERLQGPCYIILDDIRHIKHHRSLKQMGDDLRFTILTVSDEKFGFCIAKFTPADKPSADIRRILWVRTDSIGDNVLSMAMLPHMRDKYPSAEITVLCREQLTELYEASPLVKRVIGFNRMKALQEVSYRTEILLQLQEMNADICFNTVYSREPLTDFFAANSGAGQRIALEGNLSNISAEDRADNNRYYTKVLSSEGEHKSELERHRDFLRGIGINAGNLELPVWITPDDCTFAAKLFSENDLAPEKTIVLFAGAQHDVRLYDHYGTAIANVCRENGFAVIALGSPDDFRINQENLDAIDVRTVNLSGMTTLRQSAAILSQCRLAVGAETGLAHIACAVETPNVILLGGGHFGRFMPYSPFTSVVALPLECYGCNWQCRYERVHCVKDVSPTAFEEAVRQTLVFPSEKPRVFIQGIAARKPESGGPCAGTFQGLIQTNAITQITLS